MNTLYAIRIICKLFSVKYSNTNFTLFISLYLSKYGFTASHKKLNLSKSLKIYSLSQFSLYSKQFYTIRVISWGGDFTRTDKNRISRARSELNYNL